MFKFKSVWLAALCLGAGAAVFTSWCTINFVFGSLDPDDSSRLISQPILGIVLFTSVASTPLIIGIVFMILHHRSQRKSGPKHLESLQIISAIAIVVSILIIFFSYVAWAFTADSVDRNCWGSQAEQLQRPSCLGASALYNMSLPFFIIYAVSGVAMLASAFAYWRKLPMALKLRS